MSANAQIRPPRPAGAQCPARRLPAPAPGACAKPIDARPNRAADASNDARSKRLRPAAPYPPEKRLGVLAFLAALAKNPISAWDKACFEQPVVVREALSSRIIMVSDPEGVRRVLLDNCENYHKDPIQRKMLAPGPIAGSSLFLAEDEAWRKQRRALAVMFSPRSTESFAPAMETVARETVARLSREGTGAVDLGAEMCRYTLGVLEATIFSDGIDDPEGRFPLEVTRFLKTFGRLDPADMLGLPDFVPRLTKLGGARALHFVNDVVTRMLARRRALAPEAWPRDLLSLLLAARDPETDEPFAEQDLRANLIAFIVAGHETTANALTWTLYLLSLASQTRAEVEAEIDALPSGAPLTGSTLSRLALTRATLEEAMRLYPLFPTLSREAIGPDVLCGVNIPPGSLILISPWVVHRHERLWEAPNEFDPRRFLGDRRAEIPRFAYLPFGAGPRVCIGAAFAMQEAMIALVALMRAFRFDLAPGQDVMPFQQLTLRPRKAIRMIVSPRRAA